MVFMGHLDPPKIDVDAIEARLRSPDFAPVAESMREIGMPSAMDLFATYVGQKGDLGPWVAGAETQSRPRPAAAIYGRVGDQLAAGRPDLPGHAEVPAAERASVHGLAGNDGASARVYREYSLAADSEAHERSRTRAALPT